MPLRLALLALLLLGACDRTPDATPSENLPRGTALPPPGITMQPGR